jgi:hypothetical protein
MSAVAQAEAEVLVGETTRGRTAAERADTVGTGEA